MMSRDDYGLEDHRDRGDYRGDRGDRGDRDRGGDDYGDSGRKYRNFERPRPPADLTFDYKDIGTLRKYLSEHAKIVPSRITRLNAKQQRALRQAIQRARQIALLPIASVHRDSDF